MAQFVVMELLAYRNIKILNTYSQEQEDSEIGESSFLKAHNHWIECGMLDKYRILRVGLKSTIPFSRTVQGDAYVK